MKWEYILRYLYKNRIGYFGSLYERILIEFLADDNTLLCKEILLEIFKKNTSLFLIVDSFELKNSSNAGNKYENIELYNFLNNHIKDHHLF